jgi:DNA-binding transcriptional LysR family regulator
MLTQFRPGHEQVHMQVLAMETPRQLQALQQGEIDAGLLRPRRRYPEGVKAVIVHSEPFMVALAENHPLARHESISVADLRGQTFIAPQFINESEGFAEVLARLAETAGFSAREAYRVNDFVTATSLAAAGYGIVVLPESNRLLNQPGVAFRRCATSRKTCTWRWPTASARTRPQCAPFWPWPEAALPSYAAAGRAVLQRRVSGVELAKMLAAIAC